MFIQSYTYILQMIGSYVWESIVQVSVPFNQVNINMVHSKQSFSVKMVMYNLFPNFCQATSDTFNPVFS